MRVFFADKLPDHARTRLASGGFEVVNEPGTSGDALLRRLGEVDPAVLVVRSTQVTAAHVASAPSLSLVVRAGAGVNTIDQAACSARGIFVTNCPGKNAVAVAELTIGLMVALDRHLADNVAFSREGKWDKKRFSEAQGLKGRRLGILGMGLIGQEVARRAMAFDMPVYAWSRSLTDDKAALHGVRRVESPEELARKVDVLSVHLAYSPGTKGLVGESVFGALKHGSLFLNTSRAEVVDEKALLAALDQKRIRAGLDVFEGEPAGATGTFDAPLARHPGVIVTQHIGASTQQAQDAVADEACRIIEAFRSTGRAPNCTNVADQTGADHVLVVRHLDRVGVLAKVLDALRRGKLNVQEMENTIFAGGQAAVARIQVAGVPSDALLGEIKAHEEVLAVSVVPLRRPLP